MLNEMPLSSIETAFLSYLLVFARAQINESSPTTGCHTPLASHRRLLMKTFVESQFNYYTLIWRFYASRLNNKINNVHEKALIIVYFDYKSTFQGLLHKGASFSVHHRNIQTLAMEIYKHIKRGLSPAIMVEVFKVTIIVIISRCQDILFIRMIQVGDAAIFD